MKALRPALLVLLLGAFPLSAQDSQPAVAISMGEAEKMALASAADLRIALLRTQAAVRAYRFGVRDLLPRLSLALNESQSILMGAPDSAAKSWSVTIGQPVFSGGRVLRQRALSAMRLALEARGYADQQDALLDAVHELFYRVLVQKEKLRIQREVRETTEQQVKIAQTEREIGSILEVDLIDAQLELSSIDLEIRAAQTLLEEYEYRVKQVLGMDPEDRLELEGGIDPSYAGIALPPNREYFYKIAAQNNTALKKQDLEIRKAREDLRSAESWYLPDVDLEVTLSVSGERYPLQNPGLSGKLNLSFPIRPFPVSSSVSAGGTPGKALDMGVAADVGLLQDIGYWTDRSIGVLNYEASRLKRADMSENLQFDIYKAIARYEQSKIAVELKRQKIELLSRKVFIMGRQLELGAIKRIDYLQAQTQLARDRSSLVEQILQVLDSERAFERMLGVRAGDLKRIAEDYPRKGWK
jgi:outer membrane protein TolC